MLKVFISQPMNCKTNDEIKEERAAIKKAMECAFEEDIELIDSFFENAPHDANPLWYLGESIKLMSTADMIVFSNDWREARGCRAEFYLATMYGMRVFEMERV